MPGERVLVMVGRITRWFGKNQATADGHVECIPIFRRWPAGGFGIHTTAEVNVSAGYTSTNCKEKHEVNRNPVGQHGWLTSRFRVLESFSAQPLHSLLEILERSQSYLQQHTHMRTPCQIHPSTCSSSEPANMTTMSQVT